MAIKAKKGYACGYCKKVYSTAPEADLCKENHNLVYVALSREDLQKLIMFIYTQDVTLITDNMIDRLQSYMKTSFQLSISKDSNG
jgi:hypothetical protein